MNCDFKYVYLMSVNARMNNHLYDIYSVNVQRYETSEQLCMAFNKSFYYHIVCFDKPSPSL